MLEIFIDEQLIDLGDRFSDIDLILKSSFLTDQSAFSFPFFFPNILRNRNVLGIKALDQNYNEYFRKNVRIRYNTFHIDGFIDIIDVNEEIEVNFTGWETTVFEKLRTLGLNDIDVSTPCTSTQLLDSGYTKNDIYACVPVDISTEENLNIHNIDDPVDAQFLNYHGDETELPEGIFFIQQLAQVPPGSDVEDFVNRIYTQRAPFYFLTFVLDEIYNFLEINIEENYIKDDTEYTDLLVFHPPKKRLNIVDTVTFKNNLPNIKINDFLKELEKRLAIRFVLNPFKRSVKIIATSDKIINADVVDITEKAEKLNSGMLKSKSYFLRQEYTNDKFLDADSFPDKEIISSALEPKIEEIIVKSTSGIVEALEDHYIKTENIVTPPVDWFFRNFNCIKIGYDVDKPANDGFKWNDHNFRLMFWNTETETLRFSYDSAGAGPVGETEETFPKGDFTKGNRSLKWEDSGKGIYDTEYSNIFFWQNNLAKPIRADVKFISSDIVDFDFTKKYRVENVEFFVEEIPIKINKNKFKVGTMKGITT